MYTNYTSTHKIHLSAFQNVYVQSLRAAQWVVKHLILDLLRAGSYPWPKGEDCLLQNRQCRLEQLLQELEPVLRRQPSEVGRCGANKVSMYLMRLYLCN